MTLAVLSANATSRPKCGVLQMFFSITLHWVSLVQGKVCRTGEAQSNLALSVTLNVDIGSSCVLELIRFDDCTSS